ALRGVRTVALYRHPTLARTRSSNVELLEPQHLRSTMFMHSHDFAHVQPSMTGRGALPRAARRRRNAMQRVFPSITTKDKRIGPEAEASDPWRRGRRRG